MSDFIEIKGSQVLIKVESLTPKIKKGLVKETREQSTFLTNYIVKNHMTGGPSPTKLRVRSGHARRLTVPVWPAAYSEKMKGGTQFTFRYAGTHIGPQGQVTTIKPRIAKNLAIPIGKALSPSGASRYSSPRAVPGLSLIKSKKGNLILAQTATGIEPYFLLKKKVEIKSRIHPEEVLDATISRITGGYRARINDILGDTF